MAGLELSNEQTSHSWENLLNVGRNLRWVAIGIIIAQTIGIELVIQGVLTEHPFLAQWLVSPMAVVVGFGSVMFVAVSYLIGKERSVARSQREVLTTALKEE